MGNFPSNGHQAWLQLDQGTTTAPSPCPASFKELDRLMRLPTKARLLRCNSLLFVLQDLDSGSESRNLI
jgi:hypothetical protein